MPHLLRYCCFVLFLFASAFKLTWKWAAYKGNTDSIYFLYPCYKLTNHLYLLYIHKTQQKSSQCTHTTLKILYVEYSGCCKKGKTTSQLYQKTKVWKSKIRGCVGVFWLYSSSVRIWRKVECCKVPEFSLRRAIIVTCHYLTAWTLVRDISSDMWWELF